MACRSLLSFLVACVPLLPGTAGRRVSSQLASSNLADSMAGKASGCTYDMIIQDVPSGKLARIPAFAYRSGNVRIAAKQWSRLARVSGVGVEGCACCVSEDIYSAQCTDGFATLSKETLLKPCFPLSRGCRILSGSKCATKYVKTQHMPSYSTVNLDDLFRRRRTWTADMHGGDVFEYDEMMRMPVVGTRQIQLALASYPCQISPSTPIPLGCGMLLGSCVPAQWSVERNCIENHEGWPVFSLDCTTLLWKARSTLDDWLLIVTTKGGGGHIAAARNLAERHGVAWRNLLAKTADQLQETQHVFQESGFKWLDGMLRLAQGTDPKREQQAETLNLMDTPCFNLLGEWGLNIGAQSAKQWNDAQKMGDIKTLRLLFKFQPGTDVFLGEQCKHYLKKVFEGTQLQRAGAPSKIISTQPLMLRPLAKVVSKAYAAMTIHLYMTDLPTVDAMHFFGPVHSLTQSYPGLAKHITLHTIEPVEGGKPWIAERTGLSEDQIVIERFLPVATAFVSGELPRPGTHAEIRVKAQLPRESEFLGGGEKVFQISEKDKMTLVMLGSQPTADAIRTYMEQINALEESSDSTHWVFLACGSSEDREYAELYVEMATRAEEINAHRARVVAIPFTGQLAQDMQGRADITITRSGGMTAGELLALASRGDTRMVLLHVESNATVLSKDGVRQALEDGMVDWEAGNARYLMQKLGAAIVTPRMMASHINLDRYMMMREDAAYIHRWNDD